MKKWTGESAENSDVTTPEDLVEVVRRGRIVKRTTTRKRFDSTGRLVEEETVVEEFQVPAPTPQPLRPQPWVVPSPHTPYWHDRLISRGPGDPPLVTYNG